MAVYADWRSTRLEVWGWRHHYHTLHAFNCFRCEFGKRKSGTTEGNQEKLMGSLSPSTCRSSLLVASCFFSFVSVIFPPHIHAYAHAHISPDEYPEADSDSFWGIKRLVLVCWAWFLTRGDGKALTFIIHKISGSILAPTLASPYHTWNHTKMSYKEERLPCLRLGSNRTHSGAIILWKLHSHTALPRSYHGKLARQAQSREVSPTPKSRWSSPTTPWRAQKTRSRPKSQGSWTLSRHWRSSIMWAPKAKQPPKQGPMKLNQYEPRKLRWSPKQNTPQNAKFYLFFQEAQENVYKACI